MNEPININAARRVLEEWRDADDQRLFATVNWQLIRLNYAAMADELEGSKKMIEPNEAQVLAALNAYDPKFASDDLAEYSWEHIEDMTNAVRAAINVHVESS